MFKIHASARGVCALGCPSYITISPICSFTVQIFFMSLNDLFTTGYTSNQKYFIVSLKTGQRTYNVRYSPLAIYLINFVYDNKYVIIINKYNTELNQRLRK